MDENRLTKSSDTTSKSPSDICTKLILLWINKFALQAGVDLADAHIDLWKQELGDLPPDTLNAAFQETMRTFTWPRLPTVGEIRSHIASAETDATVESAERAWQIAETWQRRFYFHDLENRRSKDAPALPEQIERAVANAGGFELMATGTQQDLVWMKKRFIEAYERYGRLKAEGLFLEGSEAGKILRDLGAPEKLLRPVPQLRVLPAVRPEEISETGYVSSAAQHEITPIVEVTPELAVKREQQKARLKELHPEWSLDAPQTVPPAA
jgi:hypothetical protein